MPVITTDSIVLQSFPYSDTSKILRLLTRTHGVQSVIAKGALRPRSRYGGILEAFSEGSATFYLKESRDLQTLSSFELVRSQQQIGADLLRFGGASLIAEIVLRTASETADADLFDSVRVGLRTIAQAAPAELESVLLAETWTLIGRLGFAPSLQDCIACGRGLEVAETASFDYTAGGVRCTECAVGVAGRTLPPHGRDALIRFGSGEAVPLERPAAYWRLLTRYLRHHVIEGGDLKSLEFLSEALAHRSDDASTAGA